MHLRSGTGIFRMVTVYIGYSVWEKQKAKLKFTSNEPCVNVRVSAVHSNAIEHI